MKLSLSVVDGWSRVEKMSWNSYNEGCDLIAEVKRYRDREGYYPESVHVDKIYRTRANRLWCVAQGIRMSGAPLGRPPKDPEVNAERKRQIRKDEGIRNGVEDGVGDLVRDLVGMAFRDGLRGEEIVERHEKSSLFCNFFDSQTALRRFRFSVTCQRGALT